MPLLAGRDHLLSDGFGVADAIAFPFLKYAVFGVICALGVRWFIWVAVEKRPKRTEIREARARKDIRIAQNWHEV